MATDMDAPDEFVARLLEEYHRRVALGQRPEAEDFRAEAGAAFERFRAILDQERLMDAVLEGTRAERFPRTFGEYTVLDLLGRGGIGTVYRAVHRPLARTVALKVLQGGWADDEELVERFLRGARAAAQVEHDHVVRILDVGVFEGRPYLAMSLVAGTSLEVLLRRLRATGPPPFGPAHHAALDAAGVPGLGDDTAALVRRFAALLAGPADALEAYHRRGIVHRDVKPGNLLIDDRGRLVLTDFDLARRLETRFRTRAGQTVGTPGYMSPEQWDPLVPDIDARSDVYALGCVLHETLTGATPFAGAADPGRLMKRVLTEAVPDPAARTPDLPPDARRVLLHALERRRDDRYPTCAAFAADLRALAGGGEVHALPVGPVRRAARRVLHARWLLLAVVVVFALAVGWFARPATLVFDPWPVAEVWVDGAPLGTSPASCRVRPGTHHVVMRQRGCTERADLVHVRAGQTLPVRWRLAVEDRTDPGFVAAVLRRAGIELPARPAHAARTVPYAGPVRLLFPRGAMRPSDLDSFTTQAPEALDADLVVAGADGAELHRAPVRVSAGLAQVRLGDALRARLVVGGRYRWMLERDDARIASASFHVVDETERDLAAPALALIEDEFPDALDAATREMLRRRIEIDALAQRGLHAAAFRRARDEGDSAAMARALEDLGLPDGDLGPLVDDR